LAHITGEIRDLRLEF